MTMLPTHGYFFLPYQQFSLSVSFFRLPMELYKPAMFLQTMFSQTPLLPSSLFQDLIENFPPVGWKNHEMFDVLSPLAQEPCSSHCFVARSPSVLFTFLGSNPFSAAVFRSALPVLFSEYPAKKTGSRIVVVFQNTLDHPLNPLAAVLSPFLSLSLVHLSGLNFYLSSFVFCLLQLLEPETVLFQQLQRWC